MEAAEILETFERFRNGAFAMTRQRFRNALKRSIGASKHYADGCWNNFQDSPLHYICSRSDQKQKLELIALCMKLSQRGKAGTSTVR